MEPTPHPLPPLDHDQTIAALRAEVDDLRSLVATVLGGGEPTGEATMQSVTEPQPLGLEPQGRRAMIKAAGAAVIGATAGAMLLPGAAAANDPNDITLGATKTTAGYTIVGFALPQPNQPTDHGFQFAAGNTNSATDTRVQGKSVLSVSTSDQRMPNAIRAVTTANGAAISASGTYAGIRASADVNNYGVAGEFRGAYGIVAVGSVLGAAITRGSNGAIQLNAVTGVTHADDDAPSGGVLDVTSVGVDSSAPHTLWWASQRYGKWMKLAGPGTAGAFHPVTPFRVYDSRRPEPSPGKIRPDATRLINVSTSRDIFTGAPITANSVPIGATAITYNITIVNTEQFGYLYVADGDATSIGASTINWSQPGTVLANGSSVKIDTNRAIKVFCRGGPTDFIIDVTGFYR